MTAESNSRTSSQCIPVSRERGSFGSFCVSLSTEPANSLSSGPVDRATQLAIAARAGDRDALSAFVSATYEPVWRYSAATAGHGEADDIAQETFARALRSLPRYRGDAPATTWLIGIARHVHLDAVRRRARRGDDRVGGATSPASNAFAADSTARVELADVVARLSDDRRDAFVLTQMIGLRYDEAATVCGCPVGTIRSR